MLALKLAVPLVAFILVATAAVVIFIVAGVDLWVALVVLFALLVVVALYLDRKDKARRRNS